MDLKAETPVDNANTVFIKFYRIVDGRIDQCAVSVPHENLEKACDANLSDLLVQLMMRYNLNGQIKAVIPPVDWEAPITELRKLKSLVVRIEE